MSALLSSSSSSSSPPPAPPAPEPYKPTPDALFAYIESLATPPSGSSPSFGSFLDSGTGNHSLKWLLSLERSGCLAGWDAVTADRQMQAGTRRTLAELAPGSGGRILIGNWAAEATAATPADAIIKNANGYLLPDHRYDTILADYLIGAMDGFSPYYQDLILPRLAEHLEPGGRIYVVGMQPVPDEAPGRANVVCDVRKVRDACILLAGE
ncbi:hypothetical protein TeGR_g1426 [Tetraparma gracilis]|uniref:S-adenosyl-L-methionine-dependent methyltransferase n=1 Tax=Tetraparma gracilis TaxID=2962635 RepID=A0ABQ6MX15_9STRA|nr:hypothetical protein TeGR_g1426 [Tetraparma gracilis]